MSISIELDQPDEWQKIPILDKDLLRGMSDRDFYELILHPTRRG